MKKIRVKISDELHCFVKSEAQVLNISMTMYITALISDRLAGADYQYYVALVDLDEKLTMQIQELQNVKLETYYYLKN